MQMAAGLSLPRGTSPTLARLIEVSERGSVGCLAGVTVVPEDLMVSLSNHEVRGHCAGLWDPCHALVVRQAHHEGYSRLRAGAAARRLRGCQVPELRNQAARAKRLYA